MDTREKGGYTREKGWVYQGQVYKGVVMQGIYQVYPTPWVLTYSDDHQSGQYASYWNAFLLLGSSLQTFASPPPTPPYTEAFFPVKFLCAENLANNGDGTTSIVPTGFVPSLSQSFRVLFYATGSLDSARNVMCTKCSV